MAKIKFRSFSDLKDLAIQRQLFYRNKSNEYLRTLISKDFAGGCDPIFQLKSDFDLGECSLCELDKFYREKPEVPNKKISLKIPKGEYVLLARVNTTNKGEAASTKGKQIRAVYFLSHFTDLNKFKEIEGSEAVILTDEQVDKFSKPINADFVGMIWRGVGRHRKQREGGSI